MILDETNCSLTSEESVIAGIMVSAEGFDNASQLLKPTDFYYLYTRSLYEIIRNRYEQQRVIDAVTVGAEYDSNKANPPFDCDGGTYGYLALLCNEAPPTRSIAAYAETVRNYSINRRLNEASHRAIRVTLEPTPTDQKISEINSMFAPIIEQQAAADFISVSECVDETLLDIQKRIDNGGVIGGIGTGYKNLDTLLSGLHPADLFVLAGRPGMGKTAAALNIAEHISRSAPVHIFSLEMPRSQLTERLLCHMARVDLTAIRNGKVSPVELERLTQASVILRKQSLYIDDRPDASIEQIRARARTAKRRYGCALIIVDYLQLVTAEGDRQDLRVGAVSRGLKMMAKELHCPVIALAQLNRGLEQRQDKRPLMSDLRESGAIEQDADVIAFNYLDEKYNPDTSMVGIMELIIRKQRNGPVGTCYMDWEGAFQTFTTRYEAIPAQDGKPIAGSAFQYEDQPF